MEVVRGVKLVWKIIETTSGMKVILMIKVGSKVTNKSLGFKVI